MTAGLCGLAELYREQNRLDLAEPRLQQALALIEPLSATHPYLTWLLESLSRLRTAQGRRDDAETAHRRALSIRDAHFPQGHPDLQ